MDAETALRKFMKTAAGLAMGAVLTATLYPVAHSVMATHLEAKTSSPEAELRPIPETAPPSNRETPTANTRRDAQATVLEQALKRLTDRNIDLRDALDGVSKLHAELRHLIVQDHEISVRAQARLFRDAMMSWLDDQKANMDTSFTASVIEVSAQPTPVQPEAPEDYIRSLASITNGLIASNADLQGKLRGMAMAMDDFVREASEGGNPDMAIAAFEQWSILVGTYASPEENPNIGP